MSGPTPASPTQPSSPTPSPVASSAGGRRQVCGPISRSTLSRWRLLSGQYLAIRYTERLDEAKAVNSVGSKGDSYDNALAESVNGLYKAELIRRRKRWRTLGELELATAAWVHWYNTERLHGTCGDIPPAEFEDAYYRQLEEATAA